MYVLSAIFNQYSLNQTEQFLRMKEDGIRISLQELSSQSFDDDEVIGELQVMVNDLAKARQTIPQVVEPEKLTELNRIARQRMREGRELVVSHESIRNRLEGPTPSPDSSPESWV